MEQSELEQTEQEKIDAGARIEAFVKDPDVQAAIARLASQNYNDFKAAVSDDEIRQAHSQGVVLDNFVAALQGIVDEGTVKKIQRNERERRELANKQNVRANRVKPV